MKTLVMWSGGIDSTYTIAKLLKETPVDVHAHHIYLVNSENRHIAENKAVAALLPKLEAIRPFTFSQSRIDHSRLPGFPFDMAVVCFEAGVISRVIPEIKRWTIGTHEQEGHWKERWEIIKGATRAACWPYDAPEFFLHGITKKENEMTYLEKMGLLSECWYCREPKGDRVCGQCKTCAEVRLAALSNLGIA